MNNSLIHFCLFRRILIILLIIQVSRITSYNVCYTKLLRVTVELDWRVGKDAPRGAVEVDGVDVRRWHLPTLRRGIGLVLQVGSPLEKVGRKRMPVITSYSIHYTKLYDSTPR